MNSLDILERLGREKELSRLERILAVTNGSVTQMLEVWLGEPVRIRTLSQEVKEAGGMAGRLGVDGGDEVNFREVEIIDREGKVLIRAKSWTPLKRLEPGFKEDLMKADVPIGKLLMKHGMEVRRELLDVWMEDGKVRRAYNIIRNGEILMRIEESIEV